MSIDIDLPLGPFKDALKTLFGSMLAVLFVTLAGSFLAVLLTYWGDTRFSEWDITLFLGWVAQWVIACTMLWGFLFLVLQCLGMHSLIHGTRDPLFILGLMLCNQVFVSIVAMLVYNSREISFHRPIIGGAVFFAVMGFVLWRMHRNEHAPAGH